MAISSILTKAFRSHSRTDRTEFISQNLHYASSEAIAKHVEAYLFDILDEMEDPDYVAQWLRDRHYAVKKNHQP